MWGFVRGQISSFRIGSFVVKVAIAQASIQVHEALRLAGFGTKGK